MTQSWPFDAIFAENRKFRRKIHRLRNIIRRTRLFRVLRTEMASVGYLDTVAYAMAPGNPRTSGIMPWGTCMPKTLIVGM